MRHSSVFPNLQRRPLSSFLYLSFFFALDTLRIFMETLYVPGVVSAGIDEVPERHHVGPLLQLHLVTTHPVIRKNTIQRSFFR